MIRPDRLECGQEARLLLENRASFSGVLRAAKGLITRVAAQAALGTTMFLLL